jgi:hypothetical protein
MRAAAVKKSPGETRGVNSGLEDPRGGWTVSLLQVSERRVVLYGVA